MECDNVTYSFSKRNRNKSHYQDKGRNQLKDFKHKKIDSTKDKNPFPENDDDNRTIEGNYVAMNRNKTIIKTRVEII